MFRFVRRRWKYVVLILIVLIILGWFHSNHPSENHSSDKNPATHRTSLDPSLTIILQDYDAFHNTLYETAKSIATNFPYVTVLIVTEGLPYPPVLVPKLPNVKLVVQKNDVQTSLNDSRPEYFIKSNFVLFIPDSTIIDHFFIKAFKKFVENYDENRNEGYAIPVRGNHLNCHGIKFSDRTWTLEIGGTLQTTKCGYVSGDHGILLQTKHLYSLSNPFLPPTFTSLYIQFSLMYLKVVILEEMYVISLNRKTKLEAQAVWQQKQNQAQRLRQLYSQLGVKLVLRGENKQEEWYGCTKDSSRCFDTVYNDMPEFLYRGRWTPPCCLKNLRRTAQHVFGILDGCKVRYWLEGGSLLGAARNGDIIPWDYDIDIGIYQEDKVKCPQLVKVSQESFIDQDGFSWEKAIEGEFYRVQFSETNHLHVDIFPFYPKNGVMTKNTWFKTHRQDTEFPEHFLKPLTRIQFAGLSVSAPNNVKDFLEYKFGKGVIESPKYPNADIVV